MTIDITYFAFAILSVVAFRWMKPAVATLVVFFGGWILLPVTHYPAGTSNADFPYWIIGLAMPSDLLVTKAWVAPVSALLNVAIFDRNALLKFRLSWMDVPILLWCVFPILQLATVSEPTPSGWVSCLYLLGCWGAPWLLGRLYFGQHEGAMLLVREWCSQRLPACRSA